MSQTKVAHLPRTDEELLLEQDCRAIRDAQQLWRLAWAVVVGWGRDVRGNGSNLLCDLDQVLNLSGLGL